MKNQKPRSHFTRFIFLAALLSLIAGAFLIYTTQAQTPTPQISTDKPDYSPEEIVTINGAGFVSVPEVTITVTRPTILNPVSSWTVYPDSAGAFTITYQLDGIEGTYIVDATYGTQTTTITFTDSPWKKVTITATIGGKVTCEYPANIPITIPPDSTSDVKVWAGTKIRFTAEPLPGYQFIGWTGSHFDPAKNPQTVEIGSTKTVTANFTIALAVPEYAYGALLPLAACFVAFFVIRRHRTH